MKHASSLGCGRLLPSIYATLLLGLVLAGSGCDGDGGTTPGNDTSSGGADATAELRGQDLAGSNDLVEDVQSSDHGRGEDSLMDVPDVPAPGDIPEETSPPDDIEDTLQPPDSFEDTIHPPDDVEDVTQPLPEGPFTCWDANLCVQGCQSGACVQACKDQMGVYTEQLWSAFDFCATAA